jgi:bifunctional UDP-N-acetylglucosamine pyrophosphorylase / glucosamine-1-phosphate N-acetyltransferase
MLSFSAKPVGHQNMALDIVIMAAGKGTRMKSNLPKVLHQLAGRSLLQHVLATANQLKADGVVVITGHGAEQVEAAVAAPHLRFVRQMPQLGTGHAVLQAVPALHESGTTLVLNGDVPLITPETAQALVTACGGERLVLLTVKLADATGYGRIVRGDPAGRDAHEGGRVRAIVEHKDATPVQRQIREVYAGVMAAPTQELKRWLAALTNHNIQGEYYLTDVVAAAMASGVHVLTVKPASETEVLGVNSPLQLAELERRFQRTQADAFMEGGVRLADPARFDVRGDLQCGQDVDIDVNCIFEGRVAVVRAGAEILPFTHINGEALGVSVGAGAVVGPFARLRPGAVLGDEVHIGNFVEVKNSTLARGAKANHLAYLGDATVGERVNFGAGSITANYDGAHKHRTVLEADVHVGSNCVLVAPVTVAAGATVGAGSTISKNVAGGELALARAKQTSVVGWSRPVKKKV